MLEKRIKHIIASKEGVATVEGAIWIPFVFLVTMLLLRLLFQWTEWGMVQGEMLVIGANAVSYVDTGKDFAEFHENKINQFHFLSHVRWDQEIGKEECTISFIAEQYPPLKKEAKKVIRIKTKNPIKTLRRRKRVEQAVQEVGLP